MNNYIEYFTNYVKDNYDLNNDLISLKFFHSLRVAWLIVILAKKLNLNDEDILLAFKMGLCHDLGRFYEVVRSGKFQNTLFDHATYSNKILYNDYFIKYMDIEEHILFRKVIYCHNKKDLVDNLNYREEIFANLLRDADKIDILRIRSLGNKLNFINEPDKNVLANYMHDLTIDIRDMKGSSDSVILYLSFIKDLVFDASFDLAINNDILNNLLDIINVPKEKEELFNTIIDKIKERRGKVYVR